MGGVRKLTIAHERQLTIVDVMQEAFFAPLVLVVQADCITHIIAEVAVINVG